MPPLRKAFNEVSTEIRKVTQEGEQRLDILKIEEQICDASGTSVCGGRARVEFSTGKSRTKSFGVPMRRAPPPSSSRRFNPDDHCYECGENGHYAYDCELRQCGRKRFGSTSYRKIRSKSRSGRRPKSSARRSRSRSGSDRRRRSMSRSDRRRKRLKSNSYRNGKKDCSRSRYRSRSSRIVCEENIKIMSTRVRKPPSRFKIDTARKKYLC